MKCDNSMAEIKVQVYGKEFSIKEIIEILSEDEVKMIFEAVLNDMIPAGRI